MMEAMVKLFIMAVVLVLVDWYSDRCMMCITTVEMMDNRRKEMAPTLYIKIDPRRPMAKQGSSSPGSGSINKTFVMWVLPPAQIIG